MHSWIKTCGGAEKKKREVQKLYQENNTIILSIKGIVHPKIINSFSYCSRPLWLSFICGTQKKIFFVHTMFWEHWNMLFFVVFSEPKVYFMQTQTVFVMIDSCRTAHLTLFTTHPGELYSFLQTVHHLHWGCFSLICIVTNIWLHHTQSEILCWNKSDHSKKKMVLYSTKSGYLARNHRGTTFGAV